MDDRAFVYYGEEYSITWCDGGFAHFAMKSARGNNEEETKPLPPDEQVKRKPSPYWITTNDGEEEATEYYDECI